MFVFVSGAVLGAITVLAVLLLAAVATEDWSFRSERPRRRALRSRRTSASR